MKILINNKITEKNEAKISIFSEAFMYGYGVFETMRTYENKSIPFIDEHINRLLKSAEKIALKPKYNQKQITNQIQKIIKLEPNELRKIKIILIPDFLIIISEKLPRIKKEITCKTEITKRENPEIKSLSYLSSYLAHQNSVKNGKDEAILIDRDNWIYEGAYSNLFWFEKDVLCTRKDNVLPGIMAGQIEKISPYKFLYKKIKLKELIKKEEIFISNSIRGISAVTEIDNQKIGNGKTGKNTQNLQSQLDSHLNRLINRNNK